MATTPSDMIDYHVSIQVCQHQKHLATKYGQASAQQFTTSSHRERGSYHDSTKWLSRPPQPTANISSHHITTQEGSVRARVPNRCWHPSSYIQFIHMIITVKQFTSFIHLVKQGITDKWNSPVTKAPTSCQWPYGSLQASDDAWASIHTHQHRYVCHTDTRMSTR